MHKNHNSSDNIKLVFLLNFGFAIIEIIGSILTNSVSILSDAIHDLGDSISIGISYLFEKYSSRKSDYNYTYGYVRYSVLGAFITTMILFLSMSLMTSSLQIIYCSFIPI